MRRTNTQTGARFTVRGQRYVQVGRFLYDMESGHTVRILELKTDCPECGASFDVTASLGQIEKRMLVRRCERCRKIYRGPVDARKIERRKAKKAAKRRARRLRISPVGIPVKSRSTKPALPADEASALDAYRLALGDDQVNTNLRSQQRPSRPLLFSAHV